MSVSMKIVIKLWVVAVMLLANYLPALASEKALRHFFLNVHSLSADFIQRVEDENGTALDVSGGKFYLARPGKFRWDYKGFDGDNSMGQQIVADGLSLYFYDPDLEQVTQRPLNDAIAQVPSLLLVQNDAEIDQHFNVDELGISDALSWVSLSPKAENAGYQQLLIGFNNQEIDTMKLIDGLGNLTKLELLNVNSNPVLAPDLFVFKVPDGVDVLGE